MLPSRYSSGAVQQARVQSDGIPRAFIGAIQPAAAATTRGSHHEQVEQQCQAAETAVRKLIHSLIFRVISSESLKDLRPPRLRLVVVPWLRRDA